MPGETEAQCPRWEPTAPAHTATALPPQSCTSPWQQGMSGRLEIQGEVGAQGGSGGWREGCWGGSAISCVGCPAADSIPRAGWDRGVQGSPAVPCLSPEGWWHQQEEGQVAGDRDREGQGHLAGGDGTPGAAEISCSARFLWRVLLVCSKRPKAQELSGTQ